MRRFLVVVVLAVAAFVAGFLLGIRVTIIRLADQMGVEPGALMDWSVKKFYEEGGNVAKPPM